MDAGGAYVRGPGSEAVNIFHDLLFSLEERSRRFPGLLSFPAAFWPAMSDSLLSTLTSLRVAQSVLPEDFYDGWMGILIQRGLLVHYSRKTTFYLFTIL